MGVRMKRLSRTKLKIILIILACILLYGCKSDHSEVKKIKDLEFTVVEDADIPEGLMEKIEEKKSKSFKLTYSNADYLYIIVGYGEKRTGGYSITVDELFLTDNAIYIDTNLLGPSKDAVVTEVLTYPYIVVKTAFREERVVFN